MQNKSEEKMDLSEDDKQEHPKTNTTDNLELSPESLDSSLQDIENSSRVQSEDAPPNDDSS